VLVWTFVMPLLFMFGRAFGAKWHTDVPHLFHKGIRKIFGIRVTFSGQLNETKPSIYVSNHISYLDIFVLGDIRAFFIAKSEVASWPVLGRFAKFQNTLFFERKAGRAKHQLETMQEHLRNANSLILFPEGTSTDGVHVEPFKSTLFESANISQTDESDESTQRVTIQPITIAYTHHDGQRMSQAMLDHYAWYMDMSFGSHAAALFPLKKVDVKVHYHPVCYLDQFETRKQCADHCQQMVAKKLAEFLEYEPVG